MEDANELHQTAFHTNSHKREGPQSVPSRRNENENTRIVRVWPDLGTKNRRKIVSGTMVSGKRLDIMGQKILFPTVCVSNYISSTVYHLPDFIALASCILSASVAFFAVFSASYYLWPFFPRAICSEFEWIHVVGCFDKVAVAAVEVVMVVVKYLREVAAPGKEEKVAFGVVFNCV